MMALSLMSASGSPNPASKMTPTTVSPCVPTAISKALENQLRKHSMDRVYVGIADGVVSAGTIRSHLVPDRGDGRRIPVFGLPGNPVSSLVSFELLARPALRRMMGHSRLTRPSLVAVSDVDLGGHRDGKVHFTRVSGRFGDDGRYHVQPVVAQGSHQLAATASADAMAVVPEGDGIPAGGDVAVLLLRG